MGGAQGRDRPGRLRRVDHVEVEMPPPFQREIMRMRFLKTARGIARARAMARLLACMHESGLRSVRRACGKIAIRQSVHDMGNGHLNVPDFGSGFNRIRGLSRGVR